jgi:hypothetical protein
MPALTALLEKSIDYAGLFPPASLDLPKVVRNYAGYIVSPDSWLLGRLIIPLQQLESFAREARLYWEADSSGEHLPWQISCLVPTPEPSNDSFAKAWQSIQDFNTRYRRFAVIDAVETKADSSQVVRFGADFCDRTIDVFWELPHTKPLADLLSTIFATGSHHRAKIRTGGVQAEMIPLPNDVSRFLFECAAAKVAFKATAGLHHPIRNEYALTYEPKSECATMYGFLNVFVAAVLAWTHKLTAKELLPILTCRDLLHFDIRDGAVAWRDIRATTGQIETARNNFAISFGSCSFLEPIDEMQRLNLFGATTELTN